MSFRSLLLVFVLLSFTTGTYSQSSDDLTELADRVSQARLQGDMQLADALALQLKTAAEQQNSQTMVAEALFQQGRNAMERNQYEEAQARLNDALSIYQDTGQQLQQAHTYRQIGLTYRYQSNYTVALEYVYLAMQIYEQSGSEQDISNGHNSVGVILEKMGQFEEAVLAHQKALEINYKLGDQSGIASALYNLGDIRRTMGDYQLALDYFKDALAIDQTSGNLKDIAYSHNKLATVYNELGDQSQAREHILEALALFRQIQAPRDEDWALTILAEIELESGNLIEAQAHIDGVIERAINAKYNSLLVDAYITATRIAIAQERFSDALELIEAGLDQARLNEEQAMLAQFEELRVQVHINNNAMEQAFEALQRQKQLEDKILNDKRLESIAKLQAQSEFVRRAHQIELLEKEKSLQQSMLNQQKLNRNFWITVIIAFFCVLLLLYGRLIQARTNRKLEREVEKRTQQLTDINEQLNLAYKEMETISVTDKLTGIHNRRFLEQQINADLEQTKRAYYNWLNKGAARPKQQDIIVFIIDFDNFKMVNDNYGHHVGDGVLVQMAKRMSEVFRDSDYIVRWGGEEFVAVARFVNREDATSLASRMLEAVNQIPFDMGNSNIAKQTCSIGFAAYPLSTENDKTLSWDSLLSLADAALYKVKTSGKDGWMGVLESNHCPESDVISAGKAGPVKSRR